MDWNSWLYGPGMPPVIPDYDKSLAVYCDNLVDKYLKWDGEGDLPITANNKVRKALILITMMIVTCFEIFLFISTYSLHYTTSYV